MTAMRERANIGTRWRRKRDKTLWRIVQSHRADRVAELVYENTHLRMRAPAAPKVFITFSDLRTKFEEVGP